jgi:hypothetical protein
VNNKHMSDQANAGSAAETFKRFVAAINGHDVEALTPLMSSDHLFVDSLGNRVLSTPLRVGRGGPWFARVAPRFCALADVRFVVAVRC